VSKPKFTDYLVLVAFLPNRNDNTRRRIRRPSEADTRRQQQESSPESLEQNLRKPTPT